MESLLDGVVVAVVAGIILSILELVSRASRDYGERIVRLEFLLARYLSLVPRLVSGFERSISLDSSGELELQRQLIEAEQVIREIGFAHRLLVEKSVPVFLTDRVYCDRRGKISRYVDELIDWHERHGSRRSWSKRSGEHLRDKADSLAGLIKLRMETV